MKKDVIPSAHSNRSYRSHTFQTTCLWKFRVSTCTIVTIGVVNGMQYGCINKIEISDKLVSLPRSTHFIFVPLVATINGAHVSFLIIYFSVYLICIAIWRLIIHTLYSSNNNSYVDFKISLKSHKIFKISCTVMYLLHQNEKW